MTPSDPSLYLLFDRSPVGMYRTSEDGTFHYANPSLARMLGYTLDELMTKNLVRDIYLDATMRQQLVDKFLPRSRMLDGIEVEWKTKDGRKLVIQLWGHIVETEAGRCFDATVLDVTEVNRARVELERTAKILDLVVHQMPAIYWVVDRDVRILRTGGAIFDVLGYAHDKFVGQQIEAVHRYEPGSVDPMPYHHRALAGEVVHYDTEYRGKQLAVTVAPYRTETGIVGAIGTSLDVTHSRMLERRMVDAQRAESLGVLAGGLAHDFNNLLVAVIGNADLALREIPKGTPGRNAIDNIRDAGLRAAELTHQLLTYAGHGGAGTTRIYPATIVDELLRITATSFPPEIRVTADISTDLALRGDPAQLRQVMMNLVTNARDALAGRGGSIAITARLLDHDAIADTDDILTAEAGTYIALEVEDDGPGMAPETRRHVFEPFFTTKETGHGLGLAAVVGIVRAHGGGLRLRTRPGKGTAFQILWPAAPSTPGRPETPPPTAARKVLVIDDEDLVRDVVARMIEDLGYAAVTAADGATGLALVEAQSIDAVLVDLTMPRMNGADVIATLRARRPGLPIILCSGFDRDQRGPVQADAYLPKPFRIDALERTLAKLLPP